MLFFSLALSASHGQGYTFRHVGLEEGLPALGINALQSAAGGNLWLATEGAGLVQYNGYKFTSYLNEEMPVVNHLATGARGNIWFANGNRLGEYNGLNFTFKTLPRQQRIAQLFSDSVPLVLSVSGNIYKALADTLLLWAPAPPTAVRQIIKHQNNIYAWGDSAVYQRKGKKWLLLYKGRLTNLMAVGNSLCIARNYSLLELHTLEFKQVLNGQQMKTQAGNYFAWQGAKLAWQTPKMEWYEFDLSKGNNQEATEIETVHLHQKDQLIVVTNQGLSILETRFRQEVGQDLGKVLAVAKYQEYTVAGTAAGAHFYQGVNKVFSLPKVGLVLSMATLQNNLYLGTESGLWLYKNGKLSPINGLQNEFIFSLKASGNNLYIGTSAGLFQLSLAIGMLTNITQQENLPFATVFKMEETTSGQLWCGTYTQGFLVRSEQNKWEHITQWGKLKLDSLRYTTFLPTASGQLWLGTQNSGIFKLSKNSHQHFTFNDLRFAEVTHLQALPTCQGQKDKPLWIGTNKGWLILAEVEATRANAQNQLNFIGQAVGANTTVENGGKLYTGLTAGFEELAYCQYLAVTQHPSVKITGFTLLKGADKNTTVSNTAFFPFTQLPKALALPYNSNYVSFTYAAPALQRTKELRYRYRLKGQTNLWTYAGPRTEALFANLNPSNYTLEVQARRPGQAWPSQSARYSFTIKTPFYKTWWFITLVSTLAGGLIFGLLRYRYLRLKQELKLENKLVEMERKALRLQMNPHFIFNALDSISSFIFKQDQKQAVRFLNNFAKLMRLTLESSMEHLHPVETEVSILKNYLELEKLRFGETFDYVIEVDEELDFDVGLPPMLVQPHVENAILHGLKPKGTGGMLKLSFTLSGDLLCVTIEDNGVGRQNTKVLKHRKGHRSMATQINKDRLKLLQSSLGEKIELKIIDKKSPKGEALGTKVKIQLPAQDI